MEEHDEWLAKRFEENRTHLRAVAYRMSRPLSEADDALQEAWLHLSRSDTSGVENLKAWLTTVVGRVCLDMLRSRKSHREVPLGELPDVHVPEPLVSRAEEIYPEHEALVADSVGLALVVVTRGAVDYGVHAAQRLLDTYPGEHVTPDRAWLPAAADHADLASLGAQTLDYPSA